MGLFDVFKKSTNTPWRDKSGKLGCPGDSCPRNCDEECPIWCQTAAITCMQRGDNEGAIMKFQKALLVAPDYKEAWVNMAAIYGMGNNHLEANKAYKTAYQIDPSYKNALFGLIMSCANLGQFEEAFKYCDEYAQKINKAEAEDYRRQIREKQNAGKTVRRENATEMFVKIVEHAREINLLGPNSGIPNIPEIVAYRKVTCQKILLDLIGKTQCKDPVIWVEWGAYAGMGAVALWNTDWNSLKAKGIAETLLEPRGSEAMDEYVHELIGIPFESEEGKELIEVMYTLACWTLAEYGAGAKRDEIRTLLPEIMQAMYLFGMVYEMERLDMR